MLAKLYEPLREHTVDPLAWPLHADAEDLEGLPPHVISVDRLDPLHDEGLAYAGELLAGVPVIGRTVRAVHAGDIMFPGTMPDVYRARTRQHRLIHSARCRM